MSGRTWYERLATLESRIEKRAARDAAEAAGQVADSLDVRKALMDRVKRGEISLGEAQAELARIKRGAKKRGMVTRNQAYLGRLPVKEEGS